MQCVAQRDVEDWRSEFFTFLWDRLEEIESEIVMDSLDDISKALFQNGSDIMGRAALALIEKKFGHLLDQEYSECPFVIAGLKPGLRK